MLNTNDSSSIKHGEVSFYDNTGIALAFGDKINVSYWTKGGWGSNDYGTAYMPLSVSLVSGATVLSLDSFAVSGVSDWTSKTSSEVTISTPGTYHVKFVVSSDQNTSSEFGAVKLDSVAYNQLTAVPEPGSLLALGCLIGSGALLRSRRR